MTVTKMDLPIPKGTKVVQPIQVMSGGAVVPLASGTRAKMQIRKTRESAIVLAELTTENSRIVIEESTAKVTFNLTSAQTAAFTFDRGVFDLDLIYPDNERERIVEGNVFVLPAVTQ